MGLVLEIHKPFLFHTVYRYRNHNTAGIDLIRFLLILELPFFFQLSHGHQRKIHQADKLILSALKNLTVVCQILPVGIFNYRPVIALAEAHILKLRRESGVTAVI